jgi:hypothetical protein
MGDEFLEALDGGEPARDPFAWGKMEGSGAEFEGGLPVAGVISIGAGACDERPLLSELCACN